MQQQSVGPVGPICAKEEFIFHKAGSSLAWSKCCTAGVAAVSLCCWKFKVLELITKHHDLDLCIDAMFAGK